MPSVSAAKNSTTDPLQRSVDAAERALQSTQQELDKCGLLDSALGTKSALEAKRDVEQTRLNLLTKAGEKLGLREIQSTLQEKERAVSEQMDQAVSHSNAAYRTASLVNTAGTVAVEAATTAVAGPVVGASVGLGMRTVSNLGQTAVEMAQGDDTHFANRLASDSTGALVSAVGGKTAQYAAAGARAAASKVIASVATASAGGLTTTTVATAAELTSRARNGEALLQDGDGKRFAINAAASTAAWALGDHSGKIAPAANEVSRAAIMTVGSTSIAATAEYAQAGAVSLETLTQGASGALGSAAAAHHLASRNYKVAPVTGIKGTAPENITPEGHSILTLRRDSAGVASIHMENPISLARGAATPKAIKEELHSLLDFAAKDPSIERVRISSPLLAKMSPDGTSASLRPLGAQLAAETGGVPIDPSLTPDFQKVGIVALNVLSSAPKMKVVQPLANVGGHEYSAGFEVPTKNTE